jgi:hypothetical protein
VKQDVLSYHQAQGQTFRSITAIASRKEDDRHLRVLIRATRDISLVGDRDAVFGMVP